MPVQNRDVVPVSVITTLLDESESVEALVDSVLGGTVKPAELVVADGGSTDGTLDLLERLASEHPEIVVLKQAGGRSAARNRAIQAARHEWIAAIDGGCVASPDWLENLVRCLETGRSWVGGFYEPAGPTYASTAIGLTMVYVREEAERHFVPSARSVAFEKRLWSEVGGFPEDVQFGEDTAFADALMLAGYEPAFAPEAVVRWNPPSGLVEQFRTMFSWGEGDGLKGLRSAHYRRLARDFGLTSGLLVVLGLVRPALLPLGLTPLIPTVVEQTRYKYRHMPGAAKWIFIPLAAVNGFVASLAGFLTGRGRRKRAETA